VRHAELGEADGGPALVEQAHHDLLAEHCRDGGDAHVDVATVHRGRELPVLGTPPLDDVHAAHDLEAADQRGVHADRQGEPVDERAVHPEAHP
jgi:hypothetical protein